MKLTSAILVLWVATLLRAVAAQNSDNYQNVTFSVAAGETHRFDGFISQYGTIDLRFLTFSATEGATDTSELELAVYKLPDFCLASEQAPSCDLPNDVGIGVRLEDGRVSLCCTSEAVQQGKCPDFELGKLIVDGGKFRSDQYAQIEVPAQGPWVYHISHYGYFGRYDEYESGKYATVFANCNENGRPQINVSGKADFGSETEPFDFFKMLHQCNVPVELNPTRYDEDSDLELLRFLFDPIANKCDAAGERKLKKALSDFETCSNLDWSAFIESFPSAVLGNAIHCGVWYKNIYEWAMEQYNDDRPVDSFEDDFSSYHDAYAPDFHEIYNLKGRTECEAALEGHNIYGETLHKFVFEPDVIAKCANSLETAMPECTYDLWPIPLVGNWISMVACLIPKARNELEKVCNAELKFLDQHLPPDPSVKMDCTTIPDTTSSFALNLPDEFRGAPLPDTCNRVAGGGAFEGKKIVERYDAYRNQCTEAWDGWAVSATSSTYSSPTRTGVAVLVPVFVSVFVVLSLIVLQLHRRKRNNDKNVEFVEQPGLELN